MLCAVCVARALRLLRRHNVLEHSVKPGRPPVTACGGVHVDHHAAVLRPRLQGTACRSVHHSLQVARDAVWVAGDPA